MGSLTQQIILLQTNSIGGGAAVWLSSHFSHDNAATQVQAQVFMGDGFFFVWVSSF